MREAAILAYDHVRAGGNGAEHAGGACAAAARLLQVGEEGFFMRMAFLTLHLQGI